MDFIVVALTIHITLNVNIAADVFLDKFNPLDEQK
jgi:hypothetical protein